jgi:CubicO group peptidase (beta-lactamase class C family)
LSSEPVGAISGWSASDDLRRELHDVAYHTSIGRVTVAYFAGECTRLVSSSFHSAGVEQHETHDAWMCVSCLAKALTAALVCRAVASGDLHLDSAVADQFHNAPGGSIGVLSGISLRHLLNHTHGLDGAVLADLPVRGDGLIDLPRLLTLASEAGRLAAPGEFYSYGNLGASLAAALLEDRYAMTYEQLLHKWVFNPLRIRPAAATTCPTHAQAKRRCCPALGARLSLRVIDVVRLLKQALGDTLMQEMPTGFPGWSTETGASLGWKTYRGGWFGHDADGDECSTSIRIHPHRAVLTVTSARSRGAFLIHRRLFGRHFPEMRTVLPWTRGPFRPLAESDRRQYLGLYANHAQQLLVHLGKDGELLVESRQRKRISVGTLRAVQQDTFVSDLPRSEYAGCLQFVRPCQDRFDYLWNGSQLFRRLPRHLT